MECEIALEAANRSSAKFITIPDMRSKNYKLKRKGQLHILTPTAHSQYFRPATLQHQWYTYFTISRAVTVNHVNSPTLVLLASSRISDMNVSVPKTIWARPVQFWVKLHRKVRGDHTTEILLPASQLSQATGPIWMEYATALEAANRKLCKVYCHPRPLWAISNTVVLCCG